MSDSARRQLSTQEAAWRRSYWIILTLFGLSLLALLLLLVLLWSWWRSMNRLGDAARVSPTPVAPIPVAVVPARAETRPRTVTLPARARAGATWSIAAPVSGRVARWWVTPGEHVAPGQLLGRIATVKRVPRPVTSSPARWVTRPPDPRAFAARDRAIRSARARVAAAENALSRAVSEQVSARETYSRAAAAREAARRDLTEAEPVVTRARAELQERDAAVREGERLYREGAASRAEIEEDRQARAAAATRLERALGNLQSARSASAAAEAAVSRAESQAGAAREQISRARSDLEAARVAMRNAENAPMPRPRLVLDRSSSPRATAWTTVASTTDIRAPTSGTVAQVNTRTGLSVTQGQVLLRVQRAGGQHFRAVGNNSTLRGLTPGTRVRVRVGERSYPARVGALSPVAGGRTVLQVTGSQLPAVTAEQAATVELTLPAPEKTIVVPRPAIRRAKDGVSVWIARKSEGTGAQPTWTAHRRIVRLGAARERVVEVRAGLEPGSRVIVAGMEHLQEGQPVTAVAWTLP